MLKRDFEESVVISVNDTIDLACDGLWSDVADKGRTGKATIGIVTVSYIGGTDTFERDGEEHEYKWDLVNVTVEGKWDWAEWYTDTAPPKYLSKVLGFEVSHSEAGMNSDGMSRMDVVTLGANGKENYAKAKAVATGLLPVTA